MGESNIFNEYLGENVKDFYLNKRYSDVTVNIVEELPTDGDVQSSPSNEPVNKVNKAHKMILHINSPHFEDVLQKQGKGACEIKMKEGEAKYLELLISSFYDNDVINNLNLRDLISLLEVNVIYGRDHHQKGIVNVIETVQLDFDGVTLAIRKLYSIELTSSVDFSSLKL